MTFAQSSIQARETWREAVDESQHLDLAPVLDRLVSCAAKVMLEDYQPMQALWGLSERLRTSRFQLAVLGQFNRGKSTLLNMLLDQPILPTGIVPVTAIPTFLEAGALLRLQVTSVGDTMDDIPVATFDTVRDQLERLVTESGNPRNARSITRVVVTVPSALLAQGVVLIDTPGVGSTFQHNTATAAATLPECDACLFVVSPDPPITEVELDYLRQIKRQVARVIVVLNKIDILEPKDSASALNFLQQVLSQHTELGPADIFPVSARQASQARLAGNAVTLEESGWPRLESHLADLLARDKRNVLRQAIARKASALVDDIVLDIQVGIQSLRLPAQELKQRIMAFAEAEPRFEADRRTTQDQLAGDRARAAQFLEAAATRVRVEALRSLRAELERMLMQEVDVDTARAALVSHAQAVFNVMCARFSEEIRTHVSSVLSKHQEKADALIALVRRTAAEVLDIPYRAPLAEEAFAEKHEPHWALSGRTETVVPFRSGFFDRWLPARLRRSRLKTRLSTEAEVLVTRNMEHLRWAALRNLDHAFRTFGVDLDTRMALALEATKGAMQISFAQGRTWGDQIAPEMKKRESAVEQLLKWQHALSSVGGVAA